MCVFLDTSKFLTLMKDECIQRAVAHFIAFPAYAHQCFEYRGIVENSKEPSADHANTAKEGKIGVVLPPSEK